MENYQGGVATDIRLSISFIVNNYPSKYISNSNNNPSNHIINKNNNLKIIYTNQDNSIEYVVPKKKVSLEKSIYSTFRNPGYHHFINDSSTLGDEFLVNGRQDHQTNLQDIKKLPKRIWSEKDKEYVLKMISFEKLKNMTPYERTQLFEKVARNLNRTPVATQEIFYKTIRNNNKKLQTPDQKEY